MTPTLLTLPAALRPLQRLCAACETPCPLLPVGWWGTPLVCVCPRCQPLLTEEDYHELGPTFRLLVSTQPGEETHAVRLNLFRN